jgi:DNA-binding CsgD family transcriptional regulator
MMAGSNLEEVVGASYLRMIGFGLEQASSPSMLLAPNRTIFYLNRSAQYMLSKSLILSIVAEKLIVRREEDARALISCVAAAARDARRDSAAISYPIVLKNRAGNIVMMLSATGQRLPDDNVVIFVQVADLRQKPRVSPAFLTNVLTLTPKEAQVVEFLLNDVTTASIASETGVSVETVRSHIKNAMRKMNVRTQAQLVHRTLQALALATDRFG